MTSKNRQRLVSALSALTLFLTLALVAVNPFESPKAHAVTTLPFSIDSISPSVGPEAGGNTLTVKGSGFPYTSAESVVQDGLVAQWDAINNTGTGDGGHSNSVTTWANLKDPGSPLQFQWAGEMNTAAGGSWTSVGYKVGSHGLSGNAASTGTPWATAAAPAGLPTGQAARTVEFVFAPSEFATTNTGGNSNLRRYIGGYGNNGIDADFTTGYYSTTSLNVDFAGNAVTLNPTGTSLLDATKISSLQETYDGSWIKMFANGSASENASRAKQLATASTALSFGGRNSRQIANDFTLYSMRVYNRALTPQELQANSRVDQLRFTSKPEVRIGSQDCPAAVISPTQINCQVPAGSGTQKVQIRENDTADWVTVGSYTYYSTSSARELCGFNVYPSDTGTECVDNALKITGGTPGLSKTYNISQTAGASNDHSIEVSGSVVLNVDGSVNLSPSANVAPVEVPAGANLRLNALDGVTFTAVGPTTTVSNTEKAGIHVANTAKLRLGGSGAVNATGGKASGTEIGGSGAGIGGSSDDTAAVGEIVIGGSVKVNATGGSREGWNRGGTGAGIGSAGFQSSGNATNPVSVTNITITDSANVEANGGPTKYYPGAGIGVGAIHESVTNGISTGVIGNIIIDTSGQVTARGGSETEGTETAAGIGTGGTCLSSNSSNVNYGKIGLISISGSGTVIAKGSDKGTYNNFRSYRSPGIGYGNNSCTGQGSGQDGGIVRISGSPIVVAIASNKSSTGGASTNESGIGFMAGHSTLDLQISGGNVLSLVPNGVDGAPGGVVGYTANRVRVNADGRTYPILGQNNEGVPANWGIKPVYMPANIASSGTLAFGQQMDTNLRHNYSMKLSNNAYFQQIDNTSSLGGKISGVAWLPNKNPDTIQASNYTAKKLTAPIMTDSCEGPVGDKCVVLNTEALGQPNIAGGMNFTGTAGTPFEATIFAAGGGLTFYLNDPASDPLPSGLSLNATTGKVSGVPLDSGSFTPSICVKNAYASTPKNECEEVSFTISAGTPKLSQTASVQPVLAGKKLSDAILSTPSVALNGNSASGSERWQSDKSGSWADIELNKPLTADFNGTHLRFRYTPNGKSAQYSNTVELQVYPWGIDTIAATVPTVSGAPTQPKVTLTLAKGTSNSQQPAKFCISLDSNAVFDYSATSDTRCGDTSASNTNWKPLAASGATSETLDLAAFPAEGGAWTDYGTAHTVTIYALSQTGEVSSGKQFSFTLNKVDFAENGDGSQNVPDFTAVAYYALNGTALGKVPALPSLLGFTAQGWKDGARVTSGTTAGAVGGEAVTATTVINANKTALVDWKYTPKVLDFNPKKAVKGEATDMTIIGEGFIGWGRTAEQAKTEDSPTLTVAGDTCTITALSATEISCRTAGAVQSGSGKVIFGNSRTS